MKSIRLRSSESRAGLRRWADQRALALVATATLASSACWLDRDVIDIPVVQDAATPPTSGAGGCQWVANSASGCALTSVSCDQPAACPPSWMQANSPGSCPQAGATLLTETCDGMYRWSSSSSDGTLVVACYYDMAGGSLVGIDSQIGLPCGRNGSQFGTFPQACHWDAGVEVQRVTCGAAGSGSQTDGGYSQSCSEQMPCHGGG